MVQAPVLRAAVRDDRRVKDKDRRPRVSDPRARARQGRADKVARVAQVGQGEWVAAARWLICSSACRLFRLMN